MELVLDRIARKFEQKSISHKTKNKSLSLYQRLYNVLKDLIINNELPAGIVLPSTRALSDKLDVSRTTAIRAYELLKLEGYADSQQGAGHVVKQIQGGETGDSAKKHASHYPPLSESGKAYLQNVSLINSTDDKSIAFRPGLPPLDIFPVNNWKNLSNLYWRYIKSSALSYSSSSGNEQLKRNIANYLNLNRNLKCDPRQVLIVSGSLQSLFLVGSVVLNAGDKMVVENPTFPNVSSIFQGMRTKLERVGVDNEGLRVEDLNDDKYEGAKMLHCTPSCQYPKGVKMSQERRKDLLAWASKNEAFIIENDYEHELHNFNNYSPSLFSMDEEDRVIYMSTFNRILHPSIRIGYMVVPFYLLDAVEAMLKQSHRFVPPSIQVVLNQFIEKHYLRSHVKNVISVAEERKLLFSETFKEAFGDKVKLVQNQMPSLHMYAEIEQEINDRRVVEEFAKHNIVTHSLSKCYDQGEKGQGFIMGYSSVRPPIIKKKVREMAKLYSKKFG